MRFDLELYRRIAFTKKQVVTVFMLTHNREHYLKLSIGSMLGQTYSNFILIILDNCSVDNTQEMVLSIADDRVMYLYRESEADYSNSLFARNICVTKYFIVLHDDDILDTEYLGTVVKEMEENSYDVLSVRCSIIDEKGNLVNKPRFTGKRYVFHDNMYLTSFLCNEDGKGMIYPAAIYRLSFYESFPGYCGNKNAGPAADQLVWFETERYGGVLCVLDQELIYYRRHIGQDSSINAGSMQIKLLDFLISDEYFV